MPKRVKVRREQHSRWSVEQNTQVKKLTVLRTVSFLTVYVGYARTTFIQAEPHIYSTYKFLFFFVEFLFDEILWKQNKMRSWFSETINMRVLLFKVFDIVHYLTWKIYFSF